MKQQFTQLCAAAILLASAHFGFGQGRITITGGPGSDGSVQPEVPSPTGQGPASLGQTYGAQNGSPTITEERVRQIVREELQRAGLIPPIGMNTGPVGVTPNPFSPPRSPTNALPTNAVVGSVSNGALIGLPPGGSNAVGVLVPRASATVGTTSGTTATGATGPGGSVGVLSGGSSGVGVATPSGAGATRSGATVPPTSSAGTPGTGSTGSSTGR
jgi:hypothetical protein